MSIHVGGPSPYSPLTVKHPPAPVPASVRRDEDHGLQALTWWVLIPLAIVGLFVLAVWL